MKKILRRLARFQANDRGFAMPLALGFGLVVILVATALLIRTNDDKATASLQRASDSSLNVAEAGVTKIMTFMNSNRLVATKNWSDWNATLNVNTTASDCNGISETEDQVVIASTFANWQDVDSADASKGQFKISNYIYTPVASPSKTDLGTGVLTVDGRLPDQQSIQRVQVTIPVKRDDLKTAIPGLWVTSEKPGKGPNEKFINNNEVNGNLLTNDCSVDLDAVTVSDPYIKRYTTRPFPSLPSNPKSAPNTLTSNASKTDFPKGKNAADGLTLPRSSDKPSTKTLPDGTTAQIYEYWVQDDFQVPQNSKLNITSGAKVAIYLNGGIKKGGDIVYDITKNCPSGTQCNATNFQIYGYAGMTILNADGTKTIYGTGTSDSTNICLNGNNQLYGFILAPQYTAGVQGAGGGKTPGGFYGSVWTKHWSTSGGCGSGTQNGVLYQTGNWNLADLITETSPARLDPISKWERQEAKP